MNTLPFLLLSVLVGMALAINVPPPPKGTDQESNSVSAESNEGEEEGLALRRKRFIVRGMRNRRDDGCVHDFPATGPITASAFQSACVGEHNSYRAKEQGANVMEMKWDASLAKIAQYHADSCVWRHDHLTKCYDSGNQPVGQNMFMVGGGSALPSNVEVAYYVKQWYTEKGNYNFSSTTCTQGKICGHYTQVVWGNSQHVGCGYALCPTVEISAGNTWTNALVFVCDYDPPGNYQGKQPYKKNGIPCSDCKEVVDYGWTCDAGGLCVSCTKSTDTNCHCDEPEGGCGNGAFDQENCRCNCDSGYYGITCESACGSCSDSYADTCTSWKAEGFCDLPEYDAFMKTSCTKTCGHCPQVAACGENTIG